MAGFHLAWLGNAAAIYMYEQDSTGTGSEDPASLAGFRLDGGLSAAYADGGGCRQASQRTNTTLWPVLHDRWPRRKNESSPAVTARYAKCGRNGKIEEPMLVMTIVLIPVYYWANLRVHAAAV